MGRIAECLYNSRVRKVKQAVDIKLAESPSHYKPRPKTLLVQSKASPMDLMNACCAHLQTEAKNENVFTYVYLKSLGINLGSICMLPFVDVTTSRTVNVQVMTKMFGIATAKMSHMYTIQTTFDYTNQSFHPTRIQMLGDHLTCTGAFYGVDHTGMSKRKDGFLQDSGQFGAQCWGVRVSQSGWKLRVH